MVGGAQVYELALPLATHQVLTEVDLSPAGDARYPAFSRDEWVEVRREHRPDLGLDWVWWERAERLSRLGRQRRVAGSSGGCLALP